MGDVTKLKSGLGNANMLPDANVMREIMEVIDRMSPSTNATQRGPLTSIGARNKLKDFLGEKNAEKVLSQLSGGRIVHVPRRGLHGPPILDVLIESPDGTFIIGEAKWSDKGKPTLGRTKGRTFIYSGNGWQEITSSQSVQQMSPKWIENRIAEIRTKGDHGRRLAAKLQQAYTEGRVRPFIVVTDRSGSTGRLKDLLHEPQWAQYRNRVETYERRKLAQLELENSRGTGNKLGTVRDDSSKRLLPAGKSSKFVKLKGMVPGNSNIVSTVLDFSGAKKIIGGWADDLSDYILGTGKPSPVELAVKKAERAIDDEWRYLIKKSTRRVLWTAYFEGETLFAQLNLVVSSIVRPALLGNRPVHKHIYAIVPKLLDYYLLNHQAPTVTESANLKTTNVTPENSSRLLKANLFHPKYNYLITPGLNLLFNNGETLHGTFYTFSEQVDLNALRNALPDISGTWFELEQQVSVKHKYSKEYLKKSIFERLPTGRELIKALRGKFVFQQDQQSVSIDGISALMNELGKLSYGVENYSISGVQWNNARRSLKFKAYQTGKFKLNYNLVQIDAGMLIGKIIIISGYDEQEQRFSVTKTHYVIFVRLFPSLGKRKPRN